MPSLLSALQWPYLLGLLVFYQIVLTYLQYKRLSHIKGPWISTLTPFWLFYHTCRGDLYLALHKNIQKYGSPLRVAPNTIVYDDPQIIRTMAAPKAPFVRGHWFNGVKFDQRTHNLLSVRDEEQHAEMRRKMIPGYSGAEIPTLEQDVNGRIIELIDLIHQYINKNQAFDFAKLAHFFTLDILTKIAFGEPLGFMTQNKDLFDYIATSSAFYPIMELQANHPMVYKFFSSRLMAGAQPKPTDKIGFGKILGHAQAVVESRLNPGAEHKSDMMGSFIKHGLGQVELESESILVLLAGSDSTATALRTVLYYILTNGPVYAKLIAEITAAVSNGIASRPVITTTEAQALPYLRAVIMEALRMFMPLMGLATRNPPKGGIILGGVYVPEGTEIGMAWYSMLHRKDIFGGDADTFNPERWFGPDTKSMEKVQELVFGAGRSSCLGKNIALMELRKAIFELLYAFDMVQADVMQPMTTRSNGVVVQENFITRARVRVVV